jgi:hypothetical protein
MKRKENHEEDQNYHKELHLYYVEVMIVRYAKKNNPLYNT